MIVTVATMWHNGGEVMELEDIKIGDVLFLKDKIEGQMVRERVPMDKSDIKDNPNYGIYYEERKGRGYIFQLKKDVYQNPDIIHPFNYIKVDIDKDGDRLKISAGYPPRSKWPSTGVREVGEDGQGEHLTMGGGGGWGAWGRVGVGFDTKMVGTTGNTLQN